MRTKRREASSANSRPDESYNLGGKVPPAHDDYFRYKPLTVKNIVDGPDPVATLASRLQDVMSDDENFQQAVHHLVCRDMDLPVDTVIGFEPEEAAEAGSVHFLSESDPTYDLYWANTALLWQHMFAQCISSNKFRWTPEFIQRRRESGTK